MQIAVVFYVITTIFSVFSKCDDIAQSVNSKLEEADLLSQQLKFPELAIRHGYTPRQYKVITDDGYILTLFHIPGNSRLPVLLIHGILDSADTWLLRGRNSLGIKLAHARYDVWFGNTRGNRYSRQHLHLNPDQDSDFWKYSFHEIGYYDLPAIIDKVLKVTSAPNVTAIAHSQGNTAFYVLGSTKPQYNSKINVMLALAPVCYLHHSPPPISIFSSISPVIELLLENFKVSEIFGDTCALTKILRKICLIPNIGYSTCALPLFTFVGFHSHELEPSFFSKCFLNFPAGTSARSLFHYLQVGRRRIFAPYDYGTLGNQITYNSTVPPSYTLSNVTFPVALLAAKNDPLSTLPDVNLLKKQLPNVVFYFVIQRPLFSHLEHTWGRHVHIYSFPHIFKILKMYNEFP